LEDDLSYFPRYDAIFLYRLDVAERWPIHEILKQLAAAISNESMVFMNSEAKLAKKLPRKVAAEFIHERFKKKVDFKALTRTERIILRSQEHLKLVSISLLLAIFLATPLGIYAAKWPRFGGLALWAVGSVQTVP